MTVVFVPINGAERRALHNAGQMDLEVCSVTFQAHVLSVSHSYLFLLNRSTRMFGQLFDKLGLSRHHNSDRRPSAFPNLKEQVKLIEYK